MNEFGVLDLAASGMDVQRQSLDMLARNVAAAQAAGPDGYTRFTPLMKTIADDANGERMPVLEVRTEHEGQSGTLHEMLAILDAQHSYEGDASLFAGEKKLIERTLELEHQ